MSTKSSRSIFSICFTVMLISLLAFPIQVFAEDEGGDLGSTDTTSAQTADSGTASEVTVSNQDIETPADITTGNSTDETTAPESAGTPVDNTASNTTDETTAPESAGTPVDNTASNTTDETTAPESAGTPVDTGAVAALDETAAIQETVQTMAEADLVMVDESGLIVPMTSTQASEALASGDPWFTTSTGEIIGFTTPGGTCVSGYHECNEFADPVQQAISDPRSGGLDIYIKGYYAEQITITKSLNLISYGDGGLMAPIVLSTNPSFTADGIKVFSLITIKNDDPLVNITVNITGLNISGSGSGVPATVVGDSIYSGIAFYNYNAFGTLLNNIIQNFTDTDPNQEGVGVYVYNSDGVFNNGHLIKNVDINNNQILNNDTGVSISNSDDVNISTNQIEGNNIGVNVNNSNDLTISDNNITSNDTGIKISDGSGSSSTNIHINDNNIFGNTTNNLWEDILAFIDANDNWWGSPRGKVITGYHDGHAIEKDETWDEFRIRNDIFGLGGSYHDHPHTYSEIESAKSHEINICVNYESTESGGDCGDEGEDKVCCAGFVYVPESDSCKSISELPACPTGQEIINGSCQTPPILCNDGNPNTTDAPVNGVCVYTPIVCNDGNPNTTDAPVNGVCVNTPIVCNDDNPNTTDAPVNGVCVNTPIVCNDGNPNTTDAPVNGVCVYTPITTPSTTPPIVAGAPGGYEVVVAAPQLVIPVTGRQNDLITAGIGHTCAITPQTGLRCWGQNDSGQLGDGQSANSPVPVEVIGLEGGEVVQLVSGTKHTCALTTNGDVMCWGLNYSGQLGNGKNTNSNIPVFVSGLSGSIVSISAGENFTCAVNDANATMCWGNNSAGQFKNGTTKNSSTPVVASLGSNVSMVSGGQNELQGVTTDGAIQFWSNEPSIPVTGLTSNVAIVSADRFTDGGCAMTTDGKVECWGAILGTGISGGLDTKPLVTGEGHGCTVTDKGLICWGQNGNGQLGNGTQKVSEQPVAVTGITEVIDLAAGYKHTCAIVGVEEIKCWGNNTYGQLGNGTTVESPLPVTVQ